MYYFFDYLSISILELKSEQCDVCFALMIHEKNNLKLKSFILIKNYTLEGVPN